MRSIPGLPLLPHHCLVVLPGAPALPCSLQNRCKEDLSRGHELLSGLHACLQYTNQHTLSLLLQWTGCTNGA